MKSHARSFVPAAALAALSAFVGLTSSGCQSLNGDRDDPLYDSHWNTGSLRGRAQRAFLGYDADRDGSVLDHAQSNGESIALTLRRHFLNDNPENPLQYRRGFGGDSVYNPTAAYADTWFILRDGALLAADTLVEAVVIPVDLIAGPISTHFGVDYGSVGDYYDGSGEPVDPEDFSVRRK